MDRTEENLRRIRAYNKSIRDTGEWVEEDHPRSKNGQFTSGTGGNKEPSKTPLDLLAESTGQPLTKNNLQAPTTNGNIKLPDIIIGRSIGAKAKNYDIIDEDTGEVFHLVEGTRLYDVEIFAGPGTSDPVHDQGFKDRMQRENHFTDEQVEKMQKVKALGWVDYYGEEVKAKIHWVVIQGESGRYSFKIKEWLWNES